MKSLNIYYRLIICFSIALSIGHPTLQLSAGIVQPSKQSSASGFAGNLNNGLKFSIVPSKELRGGAWIKLSCDIPEQDEHSSVPLLAQHTLFYGTEQCSREKIVQNLTNLGLDIEADSFIQTQGSQHSIQMMLADANEERVEEALNLLNQLILHPTLKKENIELARAHLLKSCEAESDIRSLQSISQTDLNEYYAQWYHPDHMQLTIAGVDENVIPLVAKAFNSEIAQTIAYDEKPCDSNRSIFNLFSEHVEWAPAEQCFVVDGKIWMKEPSWINTSKNGKTLGAVLTLLGIGGMVLAFPYIAPVAVIVGGLTSASGLYFVTADYLKDPHYIESARKTDLQYGCAYAYKKGRAGITLTPYERRATFLQEMVDRPQLLPNLPILLLADLYQLNDPVVAEIFTVDEFNVLNKLKRDFIQQRNQHKFLKETLEKELAGITAPYAIARDASLLRAKDVYNNNYYVVAKETFKLQRDASIADIEQAFKEEEISFDEKEAMIKQAHASYESCLKTPEFQSGLNAADTNLAQAELEIQANYTYHIEVAKQSIQYNQRMEYYKQGEASLVNYYNQELHNLLAAFPVYFTVFPDYLDLRHL